MTNHSVPEAVILSTEAYDAIMQALNEANAPATATLDALRRRFDDRVASLRAAGAADRLRGVMAGPAKLRGKVKAGASH